MRTCRHKHARIQQLATAGVLLGAFPLAHVMTPLLLRDAVPLCPFRALTGKPCSLCGLTRAIALATHARFRKAIAMNLLWSLGAGTMLIFAALSVVDAVMGRQSTARLLRRIIRRDSSPSIKDLIA